MTERERLQHLTRENVISALKRIDDEGMPPARESTSYDLVYQGTSYPPKYVISLAGYFSAKGQFIFGSLFGGGENSVSFKILEDLGFELKTKEETKDLPTPKDVRDVHYKYCYLVLDEKLDQEKFKNHFEEYAKYCLRGNWLTYHEGYKIKFARWVDDRVDFEKQTDEEIYNICLESQEQQYHEATSKGVNFIVTQKRYQDDFLSLHDIELIRKLRDGELLEEFDLRESPNSFPKFSVWSGTLFPEEQKVFGTDELSGGINYLFDLTKKHPKSGIRAYNLAIGCLKQIEKAILENYESELKELVALLFPNDSEVRAVDRTWIVQDFILYVNRMVLAPIMNYYWVNQGINYKVEREHGIVAAPNQKLHHHSRLKGMREGDVIVHYADGAIRATSVVTKECVIGYRPYEENGDLDLIVEVEYKELETPIDSDVVKERFEGNEELLPKKYGPLTKDLGVVQMYMCLFNEASYRLLFNEPNYWIFQGNPKVFDTISAIQNNDLESWWVHAHKSKIKIGDKIILWLTGEKSGCFALAEVTTDLFKKAASEVDKKYYHIVPNEEPADQVKIKIEHDLTKNPALKEDLLKLPAFSDFKGGNQGTNFAATKEQYDAILHVYEKPEDIHHWIYAPGENAVFWDTFYKEGIMGLGWNALGDIARFNSRDEITKELQRIEETDSSKMNDSKANWDFLKIMKPGDLIIVNQGRNWLLGYGYVTSDYYYDPSRSDQHHLRKVDWKLKGEWKVDYSVHAKTITDITWDKIDHPDYEYHHELLLASMGVGVEPKKKEIMAINQISYGPPGTGKTYHLKENLFPRYITKESSITREEYLLDILKDLTYWQVIAVILLDLKEAKVKDIYDHEYLRLKESLGNSKSVRQTIWGKLQAHAVEDCANVKVIKRLSPSVFYKNEDSTWKLDDKGFEEAEEDITQIADELKNFESKGDKEIKRYEFITFHQSYSYEDFIEGIKPVMAEDSDGDIQYEIKDGIFKILCKRAENDPENEYAIFIDEINRGNVSSIFGELITLIEPDKRLKAENTMTAVLPYSRTNFGVPKNVHIYGTMNTADRSVEALDTALRRRFSFVERMPDPELLEEMEIEGIKLQSLLETINTRIESLVDRDHTIGHAYLINVKNMQDLRAAFKDKIIPLLQEYFYGDYGKIGLVLGKGFVDVEVKEETIFSNFDYEGRESLGQTSYTLKSFDEIDFKEALEQLF